MSEVNANANASNSNSSNVNASNLNVEVNLDINLEDLWTEFELESGSSVGCDDDSEDNGVRVGSDEESEDLDYVEEGPEASDTDDDVSLDEDDIFPINLGGNKGNSSEGNFGDGHGGEGNVGEGPSNINENYMREFDEDAPDLEDELMRLHGTDSERDVPNVHYNSRHTTLELGMYLRDGKQFRKALKALSIENGYPYKYMRNYTTVIHAICKVKGCGFNIRASKVRDNSSFMVKSFKPVHTCPRNFDQRLVNVDYLTTKYLEDLRDDKNMKVSVIKRKMNREFGYDISLRKCYRAKAKGVNIICGEEKEQYRRLYDYAETVMVTNPGSMVKFKTELMLEHVGPVPREIVVFQHMYYRLTPKKQCFFAGLRPIVCLDGCHLKGMLGGQLLCAIGRDRNENMFPLAIAIVNSECKDLGPSSWDCYKMILAQ
ncbi:uncharacterized protein [Euphorbia lathyris]|uniref:uncharacterized protein n=1 Tax=Euphorbia lathyris TaxID=212925 RepID=UPI0033144CDF